MNAKILLQRNLLCAALSLAIAGCGDAAQSGDKPAAPTLAQAPQRAAPAATPADEAALIAEVASSLQACSYDGSPLALSKTALDFSARGAGASVVAEIMKFTGLPQNFDVIEGQVPNAAAVIVLGPDQLPRRVIAYNRQFMEQVRQATRNNDWAPVSIMAHEIGHHLSGHTITPGGSQPPTELEADKFSGFVLYKMGSSLADAQKALETLVPEQDGKTHPGRRKRVAAIRDGWQQACTQQSGNCTSGAPLEAAKPAGPAVAATSEPVPATAPARTGETQGDFGAGRGPSAAAVAQTPPRDDTTAPRSATATPAGRAAVDRLPAPDTNAVPSKFDRFVYDETGLLDPAVRATFEQKLFDHASKHNVEIVSLLVDDLHGLSADEYAYAMMRQLRVGKLDVGNGAVLVAAPKQGQVGVAMGPGVQRHMKSSISLEKERLGNFLKLGWPQCEKKSACSEGWSEHFFGAAEHIANDTRFLPWTIRYQSLAELAAADAADQADREATGRRYDPAKDPVRGQILRLQGDLTSLDASKGDLAKWVIDQSDNYDADLRTLQATAEGGRQVLIAIDPHAERLMPSPLGTGKRYDFIVRVTDARFYNLKDPIRVELLSYSLMK